MIVTYEEDEIRVEIHLDDLKPEFQKTFLDVFNLSQIDINKKIPLLILNEQDIEKWLKS